jgi:EAL domain-containing protein (putative c-di-GMP-specific phosphodiesterase class I)
MRREVLVLPCLVGVKVQAMSVDDVPGGNPRAQVKRALRTRGTIVDELLNLKSRQVELADVVALIQRHMGVDVAVVAMLTGDGQTYRAVAGDAASFAIAPHASDTRPGTYSERLVADQIPNVICDATTDARVADLPVMPGARVGSFVGVPLRLSDGTVYGTLCCLSHEPNPELGERDVHFLSMIGELIVPGLDAERARQRLRADLLEVIEAENVDVAYQPIFDVRSNVCLGVEALARFPAPFAGPDRTFAAAEHVGLGLALEELVVRQAWRVLAQLAEDQFLALNLTPGSLLQLARRANRREEVPLSALVVEITEHTAIDAYADLRAELERLRERGLRLAVDDAGAGYASLRHVLELRPDIVKVDRSLIHGLADDRARRITVSAFVSLANDLGATVVAEGVEHARDYDAVRELGVHAAQGYLLGRPSTHPHDLAGWIHREPPPPRPNPRDMKRQRRLLEHERRTLANRR